MPLYPYQGINPKIGQECFIAPSADVIGAVTIGDRASIWFQTVIRGDVNQIIIGEDTNVQDQCVLHVAKNFPLIIGKKNTIGHKVTLHACKIGDNSLIGMGAIIMDGVEIGDNSLVAAGALIPPGKKFPAHSFIVGVPAVLKRELSLEERETYANFYLHYEPVRQDYLQMIKALC